MTPQADQADAGMTLADPCTALLADPICACALESWRRFPWEEGHYAVLHDRAEEIGLAPSVLNVLELAQGNLRRPKIRPRSRRATGNALKHWRLAMESYGLLPVEIPF